MPGLGRRGEADNLYPQARVPWARDWPDISPVTIVRLDRWVAFPLSPQELPPAYAEPGFLSTYGGPRGVGESPDAAYLDLARELEAERERRR